MRSQWHEIGYYNLEIIINKWGKITIQNKKKINKLINNGQRT